MIPHAITLAVAAGLAGALEHAIPWSTIDGGGGTSTAGPYTLTGTLA
ncbi:MAG: hypothetical protein H6810_06355 [Phycisphaeraceae bacterium]|nr:MAG: hypothetical protein H6810_06355 [Phycisphaeraceae bacterium]